MRHSAAKSDNSLERILAEGRGELASERFAPEAAESVGQRLLCLLWHETPQIRRRAICALAGGDLNRTYTPCYGHFVGSIERTLTRKFPDMPTTPDARLTVVSLLVCEMLEQSSHDIRGLSNMNYSFLSSALYLALFSTCRDALEAARRLKLVHAQAPVTRLLLHLATVGKTLRSRRLNGQDVEAMALMAGRVLAALPVSEIPDFWHNLTERHLSRRRAVLPVLCVLQNREAVPQLLDILPNQPADIAIALIECLARLGDSRALPVLLDYGQARNRTLRKKAQAAILELERAHAISPAKTLVRPVVEQINRQPESLLRSMSQPGSDIPPEQLLRTFEKE
jgi:hypothetical protein